MRKINDVRDALPKDIYERLELWGRVLRPSTKQELSPTAQICARLELLAGVPAAAKASTLSDSDAAEGWEIERVWSQLRHPVPWKIATAKFFVFNLPLALISRQMKLPMGQVRDGIVHTSLAINRIHMNQLVNKNTQDNPNHNLHTG